MFNISDMKKIMQITLILLLNSIGYAQTNNIGIATYSIKMLKDTVGNKKILNDNYKKYNIKDGAGKEKIDGFLKLINKNISDLDNVEYKLIFNKNNSFFYNVEIMNENENDLSSMIKNIIVQSEHKFIFNFDNDTITKQTEYDGIKYVIKTHKDSLNWKLINEQQKIGKYNCYKAITFNKKKYPSGIKKELVTAWYCTDIDVKSGPNRYVGLPGLIIQLQEGKKVFNLEKIKFNKKEKKIKPLKGKVVTEKEFEKIWKKDMNNY
jgi:GLPGLI family protein